MSDKPRQAINLSRLEETCFKRTLTNLIWQQCQDSEYEIGGTYLRIDINGQNFNLITETMKAINLKIDNLDVIQTGIKDAKKL